MSSPKPKPSTHRAEVIALHLEPLPATDKLSIVRVGGYTVVARTEDWKGKALAVHIVPDQVVDTARPEFAWLAPNIDGTTHHRVKARKLQGIVSHGFLVDAPPGAVLGDDVSDLLGVTRYVPPTNEGQPEFNRDGPSPSGLQRPVYDLESWRKYHAEVFTMGEPVVVSEKVHGENGRWTFDGDSLFAGSRTVWKVEHPRNQWWQALRWANGLEAFLRAYPGATVYGEVYGKTGGFQYGRGGQIALAVFDVLDVSGNWVSVDKARNMTAPYELPWVRELYRGGHKPHVIEGLAEGPTTMAGEGESPHCREGVVVRSLFERVHDKTGRACLKVVGNDFASR